MWQKSASELRAALSAPFACADIEWRVSATTQDKSRGLVVPYVTNRAIQNRLDDTVGIDGWHNDFVPWKGESAQLCGISIYFSELNAWLTKWDGADDSDIESVKGGLSDSMKRAAVEWGIGRYLYGMPQVWVDVEQRGKTYVPSQGSREVLDESHEKWVQKIQQRRTSAEAQDTELPVCPGNTTSQGSLQQAKQNVPDTKRTKKSVRQPQVSSPTHAPAPQPAIPSQQPPRGQMPVGIPAGCHLVTGAILKPTLSGKSRTSVQLRDSAGQSFQAYTRGADNRLAPGVLIGNAQFSTQQSNGVIFYVLETYQIVDMNSVKAA